MPTNEERKQRKLDFGLIKAIYAGDLDESKLMLEQGANPEAPIHRRSVLSPKASFPLPLAAECGYALIVDLLGAFGAGMDKRDAEQRSPIMFAAENDRRDCVDALIAAGANINATDKRGSTVLMYAASGHMNSGQGCMRSIIQSGAALNAANEDGTTALMVAAACNSLGRVKVLIQAGADVERVNKHGETARDVARMCDNDECAAFIKHERAALECVAIKSYTTQRPGDEGKGSRARSL
jgi:ankyrin repeat protein